jgi:putative CocE/NonD family hydrolase
MPDGCRLSARIWLPDDADQHPVPAVLEYLPYRKDDATALRDAGMHPYFAGHGYAAVRVDMRGSGNADGILEDEYLPQEQEDALVVLRWLAEQPWCTGRVGIIGKSWGGFNGLQVAALRPPELGAVISVCSTDDRYADDVHYVGGCMFAWGMLTWASTMLAYSARPPDPQAVGDRWRSMWLDRMERTPPLVEAWIAHQRRDAYWKSGSVCEDYSAIDCPVYMVGGWADGYRNAILRFLEGYSGPSKALIGPWGHQYPHEGAPGPAIGFLQEAVRWWDHWLKGEDTGIMDEPKVRLWVQDAVEPRPNYAIRPGRWVSEPGWPSPNVAERRFSLGNGTLDDPSGGGPGETDHQWRGVQVAGGDSGPFCGWGGPADAPPDQRQDDGLSLCFSSKPLDARIEIVGYPRLTVTLASSRPRALLAVRLCDVWPDGRSTLITRGLLNLTHRDSHEHPEPLEPGRRYQVSVALDAIAYAVPAGHRLRVALSPTYWPWVWPSPETVTLSVFAGGDSALALPVRIGGAEGDQPDHFSRPEGPAPPPVELLGSSTDGRRDVRRDQATGLVEIVNDLVYFRPVRFLDSGLEYVDRGCDIFRIVEGDPLSAMTRAERQIAIGRGDWRTRVETVSTMSATADDYLVTNTLEAYEGEARVFVKTWHMTVPRDLT